MKALILLTALACVGTVGCTTKSKAKAGARAAYQAGQQQAFATVSDARRINIRFIGPVQHPEVVWSSGLTLARALDAAGYTGANDPRLIVILRQRERLDVPPAELLSGKDWPLEPGDVIEIHP
jgi:hypothetical protein